MAGSTPNHTSVPVMPISTTPVAPGVITASDSTRSAAKAANTTGGEASPPSQVTHSQSRNAWLAAYAALPTVSRPQAWATRSARSRRNATASSAKCSSRRRRRCSERTSVSSRRPMTFMPTSRWSMNQVSATSSPRVTTPATAALTRASGEVASAATSHSTARAGTMSLPSVSQMFVATAQRRNADELNPHPRAVE